MGTKIEDLTGKKFGKLTVIKRAEDYISPKGVHRPKWLCQCECGKQVAVLAQGLKYGHTVSCGCGKKGRVAADLTGEKFGKLTVIKRTEDHASPSGRHSPKWLCQCECGNTHTVSASSLKAGTTKTCGCGRRGKAAVDLTGKKFGKLTVIERVEDYVSPKGKRSPKWLCKCECGNTCTATASSLKTGRIKTCGCNRRKNYELNAKIWHSATRNKWVVNVYVGTYSSLEDTKEACDKTNLLFSKLSKEE